MIFSLTKEASFLHFNIEKNNEQVNKMKKIAFNWIIQKIIINLH